MRVLHVITRLIVGGAQENTIATVLGLNASPGVVARLVSGPFAGPEGSLASAFANTPGVLEFCPRLVRPLQPWNDLLAWRDLAARFRREQPDIVHTHSGKAGVLGRLAARGAGVPIVVHTIHGPSFGPFQGSFSNLVFRSAERLAARATTHFIVVANAMRDQYLRAGVGVPDQYSRIWSGFHLQPFLDATNDPGFRAALGITPQDLVVGKLARLFRLKGHDDLIDLSPQLLHHQPNLKFLFVGGGEWLERLQRRVGQLGLAERFIFTGLVPPEAVPKYLGVMDVLVHASLREGLPRALPQALAAGRPVIAYDCDGAPEVCLHERTGLLVPSRHLPSLQAAILRLAVDPALRLRLGETGRRFVQERFSVDKMVADTLALYRWLSAARPGFCSPPRPGF